MEKGHSGWQASLGWGEGSVEEWVETGRSGRAGHAVRRHRGWCLNEERIQWKTSRWSLDPEGEATMFLQNTGKYPLTQNRIPEVLILQLHCSEDLESYSYSDWLEGKSTKYVFNEGCL